MNVLFATQSGSLQLFDSLGRALGERGAVRRIGFTLADRWNYHRWMTDNPAFEQCGHVLVKEWEITADRAAKPDLARLAHYEAALAGPSGSGPGLFGAIVADRRLIMGPDCTYSQDYRRRFNDDALLRILQNGCEAVERAFEALRPDLVMGFACVSILEYLVFLFARARGIRYLNLRTSRVANRVLLSDTHRDPAAEIAAAVSRGCHADTACRFAREWLATARTGHAKYEGVVAPAAQPAQKASFSGSRLGAPFRFARTLADHNATGAAADNHSPSPLRQMLYKAIVNPLRARYTDRALRPQYISAPALREMRYGVFPLHTEPEVSLLLYGRPLVNQIELLRAVALSLPADILLIAKEHPWMVGKRHFSAYRKMLRVPRLRLAPPEMSVRELVSSAALVAVHTGSTWLEAAVLRKPVIALGPTMGELLPDSMVRRCRDLTMLPEAIAELMAGAAHDEAALERLIAAIAGKSVPINLYTGLLSRAAYAPAASDAHDSKSDIGRLADFVLTRAAEPSMADAPVIGAASW